MRNEIYGFGNPEVEHQHGTVTRRMWVERRVPQRVNEIAVQVDRSQAWDLGEALSHLNADRKLIEIRNDTSEGRIVLVFEGH